MEEDLKDLEGSSLADAIETRDAMAGLVVNPGWQMLDAVLAERENHLLGALLDPGTELSDMALREYRMAITTIRSTRMTPQAMLEDAEETITTIRSLEENLAPEDKEDENVDDA